MKETGRRQEGAEEGDRKETGRSRGRSGGRRNRKEPTTHSIATSLKLVWLLGVGRGRLGGGTGEATGGATGGGGPQFSTEASWDLMFRFVSEDNSA